MNRELISELYKEAVDYCVEQGPNPDGTNKAWLWEEKFAELLVRECANAVLGVPCYYKDYRSQIEEAVIHDCARAVEERFDI